MEGNDLANIKSAKKRVLVNAKKAARNKSIKSGVKTSVKKVPVIRHATHDHVALQYLASVEHNTF